MYTSDYFFAVRANTIAEQKQIKLPNILLIQWISGINHTTVPAKINKIK